jgi:hypothetical protein
MMIIGNYDVIADRLGIDTACHWEFALAGALGEITDTIVPRLEVCA